ncbi:MAG TPA: hypothetical protein VFZ17_10545 [Acidimicrobiia bacterium]|nr:hypothetical protein [Acidimicrobiia bacterium]
MTEATPPAVDAFVTALRDATDESRAAAQALLADDVEVFSPFGVGTGAEAGAAALTNPRVLGLLRGADWSAPERDGDALVVTATAAAGAPVGGFRFGFVLDADEKIDRVEQDILPGAPRAPGPLALTDAHAELLAGALVNGTTPIVAYVDADGVPHQSYRATVQVLDDQRLAIWIRDPAGGLLRALPVNPNLSVFYADRANGVTLQFVGRGHVDDTDAVRATVFDASPKPERDMDWRRRGVAVVLDVDRVDGRDSTGVVAMAR